MAFGDDYKIWRARSSGTLFTTIRMTEFSAAWLAANDEVICWHSPGAGCAGLDPVPVFEATPWKHTLVPVSLEEYRYLKLRYDNPDV